MTELSICHKLLLDNHCTNIASLPNSMARSTVESILDDYVKSINRTNYLYSISNDNKSYKILLTVIVILISIHSNDQNVNVSITNEFMQIIYPLKLTILDTDTFVSVYNKINSSLSGT